MEKYLLSQELLQEGGLCPNCEKSIRKKGDLSKFSTKNEDIFYLLCKPCSKKIQRANLTKRNSYYQKIEDNLINKQIIFAARSFDKDHFQDIMDSKEKTTTLKELPANNAWNEDDRRFFQNNPDKKFRARKAYKKELEEIHQNDTQKKQEMLQNEIEYAIVHEIGKGQRVRSYVGRIANKPYDDEAYVASLFLAMLSPEMSSDDVEPLYKEVKERKRSISEMGLDINNIYNQKNTGD